MKYPNATIESVSRTFAYNVTVDGYYCVAMLLGMGSNHTVPNVVASAEFRNKFRGNLPASAYPLLSFYQVMSLVYLALGYAWWKLAPQRRSMYMTRDARTVMNLGFQLVFLSVFDIFTSWLLYSWSNQHAFRSDRILAMFEGGWSSSRIVSALSCAADAARITFLVYVLMSASAEQDSATILHAHGVKNTRWLCGFSFVCYALAAAACQRAIFGINDQYSTMLMVPMAVLTVFIAADLVLLMIAMLKSCQFYHGKYKRILVGLVLAIPTGALSSMLIGVLSMFLFVALRAERNYGTANTWPNVWLFLDGLPRMAYTGCMYGGLTRQISLYFRALCCRRSGTSLSSSSKRWQRMKKIPRRRMKRLCCRTAIACKRDITELYTALHHSFMYLHSFP